MFQAKTSSLGLHVRMASVSEGLTLAAKHAGIQCVTTNHLALYPWFSPVRQLESKPPAGTNPLMTCTNTARRTRLGYPLRTIAKQ